MPDPASFSTTQLGDELCLLAGRLAAAEARFCELLADFDRRRGWAVPGVRSAAHWLSWRCGMRLGAARERVRVARALVNLPETRAAMTAGRLSYSKARALTRVARPETERRLLDVALIATGAQLEKIVAGYHRAVPAAEAAGRVARRGLRRREEPDGSVLFLLRLPPEEAAILDAAIEKARGDVSAETPEEIANGREVGAYDARARTLADAAVAVAERFLTVAAPDAEVAPETATVIVHADLAAVRGQQAHGTHVDGGSALHAATLDKLVCEARLALAVTDPATGDVLHLGRSARHANARQRRALLVRDTHCRFPGCTTRRRLIPHHVAFWSAGGGTDLENLILLCRAHHRAVHEIGYQVRRLPDGTLEFRTPGGDPIPEHPVPVPTTDRALAGWCDVPLAAVVPTWAGERFDLEYTIAVLAQQPATQPEPATQPARWTAPEPDPTPRPTPTRVRLPEALRCFVTS